mgnify:CR=1 FL=1
MEYEFLHLFGYFLKVQLQFLEAQTPNTALTPPDNSIFEDAIITYNNIQIQGSFTCNFDLGYLIEESKIGLATARLNVEGRGFDRETINSNISGIFDSFAFQDYTYKDLEVLGVVENKIFNGQLDIDDPNLKFSFEGLVNFSEKENIYDFSAAIEHANLNALNFVQRDSLSILNGQMTMDMKGTTIDGDFERAIKARRANRRFNG